MTDDNKPMIYAKICFEGEGVVFEKKYESEAEALAFVDGFNATIEAIDSEDDCHYAIVDSEPTKEES